MLFKENEKVKNIISNNKFQINSVFSSFYNDSRIIKLIFFEKSLAMPELSFHDRESLKMFLWHELYVYLSQLLNVSKDDDMFQPRLIRSLLLNLLKDNEHTLEGIAFATHIPIDVLNDIVYKINTNPSCSVSASLISYYIISNRDEYTEFLRRIFQLIEFYDVYKKI